MSDKTGRKDQFKASVTADDARRKREDTTIQIRKSKKEERLQKRRMMGRRNRANAADTSSDPSVTEKVSPCRSRVA
jgi:hypothetical protein